MTSIIGIPNRTQITCRKKVAKKFPSLPRAEPTKDDDSTMTSPKMTRKNTIDTMTTKSADSCPKSRFTVTVTRGADARAAVWVIATSPASR